MSESTQQSIIAATGADDSSNDGLVIVDDAHATFAPPGTVIIPYNYMSLVSIYNTYASGHASSCISHFVFILYDLRSFVLSYTAFSVIVCQVLKVCLVMHIRSKIQGFRCYSANI